MTQVLADRTGREGSCDTRGCACILVGSARFNVAYAVLVGLTVLLTLGCLGGDDPEATPIASPSRATAVPESTATEIPPPPTPAPVTVSGPVPKTIWLIDVAGVHVTTLFESHDTASAHARFGAGGEGVLMTEAGVEVEYGLDGSRIGPVFQPEPCQFKAEGEQIEGRWHPTFQCDAGSADDHPFLSPDGHWFTYQVLEGDPEATPVFPPVWAMWALNLQTSERRLLQGGLQDCGGCDSRFGPEWSPSGRFYFFSETGGAGRVFLHDLEKNATQAITQGNQLQDSPDWAPNEDVLLYKSPPGATIHYDLLTETRVVLDDMPWPARFDRSGEVIYAPAYGPPSGQPASSASTVVRSSDLGTTYRLEGTPEYLGLFRQLNQVIEAPLRVAALSRVAGCDGITLYAPAVTPGCIEGGQGATLSPDGSVLAVSRLIGVTGRVSYPGGSAASQNIYEVVLVDVETGTERVIPEQAISGEAPLIEWNDGSTHILVQWPYEGGL